MSATPRVVILSAFLTPMRSGAEACAEEVATRLRSKFAITIITARMRRSLPVNDTIGGVPVLRIGFGCSFDKWLYPFLAPLYARSIRPVIVHSVLESYAGAALILCRWIVPRARRILTCQSTNTRRFVRRMHRTADRVTVISSVLKKRAGEYGRCDVVHIPNGIDSSAIASACKKNDRRKNTILFVGRLERMKGVDILLHAFALLHCDEKHPVELRIVGDGTLRSHLEHLAHKLGVTHHVRFLGFVPAPAVYREFASATIFCALSRTEALGNVFLEAQAAGCPIVATNVDGIPDIVEDGETGLLVDPEEPRDAAKAIEKLLSDAGLREQLSTAGKQNAKSYDWDDIAKQYEAVYRDLL
jgi:glycosyltransferase involved in cell wall biosynthesis